MLDGAGELPGAGTSLGASLAVSLLSLGAVCVLAYTILHLLARRGFSRGAAGPVRVLARTVLEPRRAIYLVEVGGRCFLVGAGEGPLTLLAEIDRGSIGDSIAPATPAARGRFASLLGRALTRSPGEPAPPAAVAPPAREDRR